MTDVAPATTTGYGLDAIARPSGAFAMLAVDQREAMRRTPVRAGDRQAAH